ncbi:uncharacterized protein BT62DRAFT_169719 [Guyanagaster necrorhizus]|uniref:Uncharacterized protein n=1 Tax=Guyanagaster necrorhizus TaxID=856835 RepID=A0A9P8ARW4_9AGAR|nr:uncharacterized protein BT62DRAFT_169719 [Guyanagaster necrorhizus MCA 3950]KAG7445639.1 hypothetical protein BT62DRAFT_169719 [Guyanagaster necrorhizus MCA 3950]
MDLRKKALEGRPKAPLKLCLDTQAVNDPTTFPIISKAIRNILCDGPIPHNFIDPGSGEWQGPDTLHAYMLRIKSALGYLGFNTPCNIELTSRLWPDLSRWILGFLTVYIHDRRPRFLVDVVISKRFMVFYDKPHIRRVACTCRSLSVVSPNGGHAGIRAVHDEYGRMLWLATCILCCNRQRYGSCNGLTMHFFRASLTQVRWLVPCTRCQLIELSSINPLWSLSPSSTKHLSSLT